jgi:hypothetical protein
LESRCRNLSAGSGRRGRDRSDPVFLAREDNPRSDEQIGESSAVPFQGIAQGGVPDAYKKS